MLKEELVNQLNEVLEMDHRLSHWQFSQIRKYELQEMVAKVYSLQVRISEYRDRLHMYERTFGVADGYQKE